MKATYWQKGETLDYTAAAAVKNGAVVSLGTRIGVAGTDIADGGTGAVHVVGVFEMDKTAGQAITMGAAVYYDAAGDVITTASASNVPAGYAAAPAAAGDATVYVKLLG